jgi:hypothetical protein
VRMSIAFAHAVGAVAYRTIDYRFGRVRVKELPTCFLKLEPQASIFLSNLRYDVV